MTFLCITLSPRSSPVCVADWRKQQGHKMIYLSDSFSFRTFLVMRNFGRCRPSSAWRQFSEYNLQHGGGVLITEGGRPLPPCLTGWGGVKPGGLQELETCPS